MLFVNVAHWKNCWLRIWFEYRRFFMANYKAAGCGGEGLDNI